MSRVQFFFNYYTGTPLSPEDHFPGSPVKVKQQTYTYTTHNTVKSVSKSVNQSVSSVDGGGCHFIPLLLEVIPQDPSGHPISFDHWSSLQLLGHLHPQLRFSYILWSLFLYSAITLSFTFLSTVANNCSTPRHR